MSSEEQNLPVSLERLEIVSRVSNSDCVKVSVNPFSRKQFSVVGATTKYHMQKPLQLKITPFKKSHNKSSILKEPILKFIVRAVNTNDKDPDKALCSTECRCKSVVNEIKPSPLKPTKVFGDTDPNSQNFKSLLSSCAELTLKPTCKQYTQRTFKNARIKNSDSNSNISTSNSLTLRPAEVHSTCSQQARMNEPCDITIDELASYFETFVHIPKKMSTMAEMMYI